MGGLGESDPGCIFVVKYILSVLMDDVGTGYHASGASGVTCHTYSTYSREHAWDWENLMFVYLCHIDL